LIFDFDPLVENWFLRPKSADARKSKSYLITNFVVIEPFQQLGRDVASRFHESAISEQEVFDVRVNAITIKFQVINQLIRRPLKTPTFSLSDTPRYFSPCTIKIFIHINIQVGNPTKIQRDIYSNTAVIHAFVKSRSPIYE